MGRTRFVIRNPLSECVYPSADGYRTPKTNSKSTNRLTAEQAPARIACGNEYDVDDTQPEGRAYSLTVLDRRRELLPQYQLRLQHARRGCREVVPDSYHLELERLCMITPRIVKLG